MAELEQETAPATTPSRKMSAKELRQLAIKKGVKGINKNTTAKSVIEKAKKQNIELAETTGKGFIR
jgi:transcriptional/translational regulatory protein YebC/TACO1